MKKPFVVGDRVRVYGMVWSRGDSTGAPVSESLGTIRKIKVSNSKTELSIEDDESRELFDAHPKQCRRLVKKERRRVWVVSWVFKNLAGAEEFVRTENPHDKSFKEFVEVKK